jgi:hypothetical protein
LNFEYPSLLSSKSRRAFIAIRTHFFLYISFFFFAFFNSVFTVVNLTVTHTNNYSNILRSQVRTKDRLMQPFIGHITLSRKTRPWIKSWEVTGKFFLFSFYSIFSFLLIIFFSVFITQKYYVITDVRLKKNPKFDFFNVF